MDLIEAYVQFLQVSVICVCISYCVQICVCVCVCMCVSVHVSVYASVCVYVCVQNLSFLCLFFVWFLLCLIFMLAVQGKGVGKLILGSKINAFFTACNKQNDQSNPQFFVTL